MRVTGFAPSIPVLRFQQGRGLTSTQQAKPILTALDIDLTLIPWKAQETDGSLHQDAYQASMNFLNDKQDTQGKEFREHSLLMLNTGKGLTSLKAVSNELAPLNPIDALGLADGQQLYINANHEPTQDWIKRLTSQDKDIGWVKRLGAWDTDEAMHAILDLLTTDLGFKEVPKTDVHNSPNAGSVELNRGQINVSLVKDRPYFRLHSAKHSSINLEALEQVAQSMTKEIEDTLSDVSGEAYLNIANNSVYIHVGS